MSEKVLGFSKKKYSIIYADPAWKIRYFKETKEGKLSRKLPYKTMTDKEIKKLPIKNIATKNAILFLWAVDSKIPLISEIMREWGFKYKTIGFVWVKKAKNTNGTNATFGSYTRKSCEFCYIGTKGKYLIKNKNIEQLVVEPKRKHSQKPDIIRNRIVAMVGDLPRIELFARQRYEGWDAWGNEVTNQTQSSLRIRAEKETKKQWGTEDLCKNKVDEDCIIHSAKKNQDGSITIEVRINAYSVDTENDCYTGVTNMRLRKEAGGQIQRFIKAKKDVSVRLVSESVDIKEHKKVLEENRILKQALKYLCNQNNITYDHFWKRIKPDKWRDYIAKIIKTE